MLVHLIALAVEGSFIRYLFYAIDFSLHFPKISFVPVNKFSMKEKLKNTESLNKGNEAKKFLFSFFL